MRVFLDANIQFSVTGDRTHFGAGYDRTFGGVTIHSPSSLAEQVLARG